MPKKENKNKRKTVPMNNAYIKGAGIVERQPITQTLEKNYMPYAMSVILSRALPEIDGFKPSHRKILYTMYNMGLLTGRLTKSANIVGSTMKFNPHGDATIYETMVRLSRGYEALLHPYVESKGNFGKSYSKDMAYAASRYTEAKLSKICEELFRDIDKNTIEYVPNYDNTTKEPTLLPVTFPSILVNSNMGIAVSMASSICSFNLKEVCETMISIIKNREINIIDVLKGPDFIGGGKLIYDDKEIKKIYETGRGSIKIRGKCSYDKQNNCIDITEIPPTTTIEAIMNKIAELVKQNKIKEISDLRDETDLNGLKITVDLKRGVDADRIIKKLYRFTPLEDTYACNFNILIDGVPKVMGIYEILNEWHKFRRGCVRGKIEFELKKKSDKLHLLRGLKVILMDIDKAIKIIRETGSEDEVVSNLMIGFGIDETQAEYVAEIKLRHLNKEYIINRTDEIDKLKDEVLKYKGILGDDSKLDDIICDELQEVIKKYAKPRKTMLLYLDEIKEDELEDEIPDYKVNLFITKDGYLKKITDKSLRMNANQKLKENDKIVHHSEQSNDTDLLFFTDRACVYKTNLSTFKDGKSSLLGDYIPATIEFSDDEKLIYTLPTNDYRQTLLFFFENGKMSKIPAESYKTKNNRKKLVNAYSTASNLVGIFIEDENSRYVLITRAKKMLIINTDIINKKTSRASQGSYVMKLNKDDYVEKIVPYNDETIENSHRYITKNLPAKGKTINPKDLGTQTKL